MDSIEEMHEKNLIYTLSGTTGKTKILNNCQILNVF